MALEILTSEWKGLGDHHVTIHLRNSDACVLDFKFKARGGAHTALTVKPSHGALPPGGSVWVDISIAPGTGVSFDDAMPTVCYKSEFDHSWILERLPVPSRSTRPSPDAVDPTPKFLLRGSSIQDVPHPPEAPRPVVNEPTLMQPLVPANYPPRQNLPHVSPALITRWTEYNALVRELRDYIGKGVKVRRLGLGTATPALKHLQWTKVKNVEMIRISKSGDAPFDVELKVSTLARVVLGKPCPTQMSASALQVDVRALSLDVRNGAPLHLRFNTSDDFEGFVAMLALVPHLHGKIEWNETTQHRGAAQPQRLDMTDVEALWAVKSGLAFSRYLAIRDACLQSEHGSAWTPLDLVDKFGVSLFHAIVVTKLLPQSRGDSLIALQALVHI